MKQERKKIEQTEINNMRQGKNANLPRRQKDQKKKKQK